MERGLMKIDFIHWSILKVEENNWGEIDGIEMVHTSPKDESREKKESEREYWGEMERRLVKIDFIHWVF